MRSKALREMEFAKVAGRQCLLMGVLVAAFVAGGSAGAQGAPLSIEVSGNHFVNGSGETLQLVGVDRPGTEYACAEGWGYSAGPIDDADAAAIAGWHANAVRIPLNEDCWLGINGYPAGGLSSTVYRQTIESYVKDLGERGIYAILDLHWVGPGSTPAYGQRAMPDAHSLELWSSVASAFKEDRAVLFDAYNEPYSPAYIGQAGYEVSWSCWLEGGCSVPVADQEETVNPAQTYEVVGMQQIVNTIRATGARQPILLGGLSYANDLSQWLTHEPIDPDGQLAASFHNYTGETCDTLGCWNATIAPLAQHVPVVTGEFDEDDCPPSGDDPGDFDNTYMDWADLHGVSYLAWGWFVLEPPQPCSALYLITGEEGEPASPNGVALHDHLLALYNSRLAAAEERTTATGCEQHTTPGATPKAIPPPIAPVAAVATVNAPALSAPVHEAGHFTLQIHSLKALRGGLAVRVTISSGGVVIVTGPGLTRKAEFLAAGSHTLQLEFTSLGRREHRRHEQIKVSVALRADDSSVSTGRYLRL